MNSGFKRNKERAFRYVTFRCTVADSLERLLRDALTSGPAMLCLSATATTVGRDRIERHSRVRKVRGEEGKPHKAFVTIESEKLSTIDVRSENGWCMPTLRMLPSPVVQELTKKLPPLWGLLGERYEDRGAQ